MKILALGDLHLSDKTPENRIDKYPEIQFKKIEWILDLARKEKVDFILQPGDLFDSHRASNDLIRKYIKLFNKYEIPIYCCPGQHDLRYHNSSTSNTPIGVLDAAETIFIVNEPIILDEYETEIIIYSAGWGQPIPEIENKNDFNILITHKMIIKDEKIWYDQEDYTLSSHLLRKSGFNLIVSGDNHAGFIQSNRKGHYLINNGSLMRSRSDQMNHTPRVNICNLDGGHLEIERFNIPVEDIENVMSIEKIKGDKIKNKELESYVEKLSSDTEIKGLDFKKNIINFVKKNNVEQSVKKIIDKILGG
jgi:DNA repair exonuclease SbcCD nuclease subunit